MSDTQPIIACNLGALSAEERTRRSTVSTRISARFQEVRETLDGYPARFNADGQLVQDALVSGGPSVRDFLGAAGFKASPGTSL